MRVPSEQLLEPVPHSLDRNIEETKTLCREQGVELQRIEDAEGFERTRPLDDTLDALVAFDERKKRFPDHPANVERLKGQLNSY